MPDALAQMGGAFRDPGMPDPLPPGTALPPGMIAPGTINLQGRPIVIDPRRGEAFNPVSTELSGSDADELGREILYPTVVNGRFLTPSGEIPIEGSEEEKAMNRAAWKHYENTGEHMGMFVGPRIPQSPELNRRLTAMADAYARQAHMRPMDLQSPVYLYRPPSSGYLQQLYKKFGGGE